MGHYLLKIREVFHLAAEAKKLCGKVAEHEEIVAVEKGTVNGRVKICAIAVDRIVVTHEVELAQAIG